MRRHKAVFLDRDGALVSLVDYPGTERVSPRTVADFVILPGAKEFVQSIKNMGYRAIVITNQSGIADGAVSVGDLDAMHRRLKEELGVDDIFVCPHAETERCQCRKPKPGMILDAAEKYGIDLARSFVMGDWWRDMEAGKNAGVKTILFSLPSNKHISGYDYLARGYDDALAVIARSSDMAELNFMDKDEYARLARREHFYFWNIGRREILREAIARNVPQKHSAFRALEILDMGCGPGGNILTLGEFGQVIGLDISKDALQLAHDRGFKELIQGDARRLSFPDNSFDMASCLDVLEHIDDDELAVREAFRVLRPGGIFLATVPAHPWLWSSHDEALRHLRRYTTAGMIGKLRSAGFEIREHSHFIMLAVPINFLRRTLGTLRKKTEAAETYDREFSSLINAALLFLLRCEKVLIRFFPLPFGSSLFVVAQKL